MERRKRKKLAALRNEKANIIFEGKAEEVMNRTRERVSN